MAPTPPTVTTEAAAAYCGISYRQLDYLARTVPLLATEVQSLAAGSGSRRRWPADTVAKLYVAAALNRTMPAGEDRDAPSALPAILGAVLAAATPPAVEGWVLYSAGEVWYRQGGVVSVGVSAIAARYDLTAGAERVVRDTRATSAVREQAVYLQRWWTEPAPVQVDA